MTISAIALRKNINNLWSEPPIIDGRAEDYMDHDLQVLLAIGISAALCLVTWIWARRGRGGVFQSTDS